MFQTSAHLKTVICAIALVKHECEHCNVPEEDRVQVTCECLNTQTLRYHFLTYVAQILPQDRIFYMIVTA